MKIIFLIIIALASTADSAISQWEKVKAKTDSSYARMICFQGVLIACVGDSTNQYNIFVSKDRGYSWNLAQYGWSNDSTLGYYVRSFASNDTVLIAASYSGLYKTTDTALTWKKTFDTPSRLFFISVAVKDGLFFAGSIDGDIYGSTDEGESWYYVNKVDTTVHNRINQTRIIENALFALVRPESYEHTGPSVYRSLDLGKSWTRIYSCDLGTSPMLYVSGRSLILDLGAYSGIFKSKNMGSGWNRVPALDNTFITYEVFLEVRDATVCSVYSKILQRCSILLSTDDGDTWKDISANVDVSRQPRSIAHDDEYIYLGYDNGLWRRRIDQILSMKEEYGNDQPGMELSPNYPNPFSGSSSLQYKVNQQSTISIDLHDALGRHIRTLVQGSVEAGTHIARIDAAGLKSGTYFFTLRYGNKRLARPCSVIR